MRIIGEVIFRNTPQELIKAGSTVANIKSQMKRIKTNAKAQERNKAVRSNVKTSIRRVHEAVEAGDAEAAQAAAQVANRELDRAASKGVIHKNQAANRKSAVAKSAAGVK